MPSLLTQTPPTTEASEVSAPPSQPSESHVALLEIMAVHHISPAPQTA